MGLLEILEEFRVRREDHQTLVILEGLAISRKAPVKLEEVLVLP